MEECEVQFQKIQRLSIRFTETQLIGLSLWNVLAIYALALLNRTIKFTKEKERFLSTICKRVDIDNDKYLPVTLSTIFILMPCIMAFCKNPS